MRKMLIALALTAAAFTSLAGVAAADDPGANRYIDSSTPGQQTGVCVTPARFGVWGQFGAWGYYVDGCTTPAVVCQRPDCAVTESTYIDTQQHWGNLVTQNARLAVFWSTGAAYWWHDVSCGKIANRCFNSDSYYYIHRGQMANSQCNGVHGREGYLSSNAFNYCSVTVRAVD
jgi:hypothetical protein